MFSFADEYDGDFYIGNEHVSGSCNINNRGNLSEYIIRRWSD